MKDVENQYSLLNKRGLSKKSVFSIVLGVTAVAFLGAYLYCERFQNNGDNNQIQPYDAPPAPPAPPYTVPPQYIRPTTEEDETDDSTEQYTTDYIEKHAPATSWYERPSPPTPTTPRYSTTSEYSYGRTWPTSRYPFYSTSTSEPYTTTTPDYFRKLFATIRPNYYVPTGAGNEYDYEVSTSQYDDYNVDITRSSTDNSIYYDYDEFETATTEESTSSEITKTPTLVSRNPFYSTTTTEPYTTTTPDYFRKLFATMLPNYQTHIYTPIETNTYESTFVTGPPDSSNEYDYENSRNQYDDYNVNNTRSSTDNSIYHDEEFDTATTYSSEISELPAYAKPGIFQYDYETDGSDYEVTTSYYSSEYGNPVSWDQDYDYDGDY